MSGQGESGKELAGMVRVGPVKDFDDGTIVPIDLPDSTEIIVYRSGESFYATQRNCLHQGFDMADGLVDDGFLICPLHGWRFRAATGVHELSPETCLRTYAVHTVSDVVYVASEPARQGITREVIRTTSGEPTDV